MSVETGVACSARELLVVLVRNVPTCSGVFVALGQAEVNDVDYVLLLAEADQEVVWLDVAMKEAILVNEFDTLQHLDCQHEHRFVRELLPAVFEQVLE